MANANKSEVDLTIGDKTYTLKFGRNAMASVESLFGGTPFPEVAANRSYSAVRAMLWAALQHHHSDIDLIAVGDLMDELNDDAHIGIVLGKAISLALPKKGRPQKPDQANGTGTTT